MRHVAVLAGKSVGQSDFLFTRPWTPRLALRACPVARDCLPDKIMGAFLVPSDSDSLLSPGIRD